MEKFIIGLLGGVIVILIIYIKNFIKEKQFEKKYSISGEYITKYEDENEGEILVFTAPAEIKQRGNIVSGYTYLSEGEQRWIFEGRISVDGYFYGIYHAEGVEDKGIGNFFLKIGKNGNMDGLWSGVHSVNSKINSGKYIFRPILKDIIIDELQLEYFPEILNLADQQLGRHFLTKDILEDIINDKDNYIGKVMTDLSKKVIGFYVCYIVKVSQVESKLNIPEEKVQGILTSEKIGILEDIVVSQRYRENGIEIMLIKDSIEEVKKRNINTICAIRWKSKYGVNLRGVLKNFGFKQILELKDYWREDSINKGYSCPICGEPPCKCSAVIFKLNV